MMRNLLTINLFHRLAKFSVESFLKYHKMPEIPTVFVRQFENEETMKITFLYSYSGYPIQNYTFMRSKNELLKAAIARMKCKIQSTVIRKASKKNKKIALDEDKVLPSFSIALIKNGVQVDENTKNEEAWKSDAKFIINDECYQIVVNPPCVVHISLPKCIMSGFPVYPKVTFEFSSIENSIFKWYRKIEKSDADASLHNEDIKDKNDVWKFISEGYLYVTGESDVGTKLRVSCLPLLQDKVGLEEAAISVSNIISGPKRCPFEDRHQFTKEMTNVGSFRFVSYNILADLYADTDTARTELFPYCPVECLDIEYRKQLYLKEIIGYNADILCLQEVDRRVFHDDLVPVLTGKDLKGVFNEKGGQVAEGLSCFYRNSKFKLIESHSIVLSEAVKTEAALQKLYTKISENENLFERFMNRTTALQVALLESLDASKRILIGNTHLYFHPDSDNIRLLQATCCLLYLEHLIQEYQKQFFPIIPLAYFDETPVSYPNTISLILSGDFNSCPEFGVYKLATEGFLPSSCIDWHSNPTEKVDGMDLSHSLKLDSACGTPKYTNFTQGFVGCLDYIFYDKNLLKVTEVVPFPPHEEVTKHIALPNQDFPSDHLALVSVLSWK